MPAVGKTMVSVYITREKNTSGKAKGQDPLKPFSIY